MSENVFDKPIWPCIQLDPIQEIICLNTVLVVRSVGKNVIFFYLLPANNFDTRSCSNIVLSRFIP